MAKQVWTVRLINPVNDEVRGVSSSELHPRLQGAWVECLRYAGYLTVLREYDGKTPHEVLELYCPDRTYDTKVWAEQNAARMQSFGINAVAAPKWVGGTL